MKSNILRIQISKSVHEVFIFTITPPNSKLWINSIKQEKTNEFPIRVGTVYKLQDEKGTWSEVTVTAIKENEFVEWISKDKNYHCRYTYKPIDDNTTKLIYNEWTKKGKLAEPFTFKTLETLKFVLENRKK